MIATPFLVKAAPRIGYALQPAFAPGSALEPTVTVFRPEGPDPRGHVVIVGYGLNGRNFARLPRKVNVPHLVLGLNAEAVREARALEERIIYGDATRKGVLYHAGLRQGTLSADAIMKEPDVAAHAVE